LPAAISRARAIVGRVSRRSMTSSIMSYGIRLVSARSRSRATFISPVMPIEPAMTVKS